MLTADGDLATLVARPEAAGAVLLGKTNLENQEWYIHGIKERMNIYTPLPDWTNFSRIYDNGDSWILKGQDRML